MTIGPGTVGTSVGSAVSARLNGRHSGDLNIGQSVTGSSCDQFWVSYLSGELPTRVMCKMKFKEWTGREQTQMCREVCDWSVQAKAAHDTCSEVGSSLRYKLAWKVILDSKAVVEGCRGVTTCAMYDWLTQNRERSLRCKGEEGWESEVDCL
jgi:hypothetical protein